MQSEQSPTPCVISVCTLVVTLHLPMDSLSLVTTPWVACADVCSTHWDVGILAWLWRRFTTDLPAGVTEMNQRLVEEAEAGDLPLGSQV